jgi:hypothetical protein
VLTHSSSTHKNLSYSRSLISRSVQPKLTQTQSEDSTIVLKSNWDNHFTSQNSNRKDDMMKVLRGKEFVLSCYSSQDGLTGKESTKSKFKLDYKHISGESMRSGLTRLSKKSEQRRLMVERMKAGERMREQN